MEHFAFEVQLALVELKRLLDCVDDLHATRMTAEAIHVCALNAHLGAHAVDGFGQMFFDEWRNGSIEDDRKPWVFDVPTHDPQCVGIELFL